MRMSKRMLCASASFVFVVATSGCATKSYVSKKIGVVDQRLNQLQAQGKEALEKHDREISQLGERMTTTDNHLAAVNSTAQQATSTAGQALQQAQSNTSAIESNTSAIGAHSEELTKLGAQFNYSLVESDNVTFAFNKWGLSKDAKTELDQVIQKALATPRSRIEVLGYTDSVGSSSYNLTLSRRRAEAVQRYLIKNNVQPMSVSAVALGEEQTPEQLGANPNATKRESRGLARRVNIKLYAPGGSSSAASASASAELHQ